MKKSNIFKCLLAAVMLVAVAADANARGEKRRPLYDSKSWIVNVAGDAGYLKNRGFGSKINYLNVKVPQLLTGNPEIGGEGRKIAAQLNQMGFGKTVIDALTANGTNDNVLKRCALANAQRNDLEVGAASVRAEGEAGLRTVVSDDYEPILMHNYIVMTHSVPNRDKNGKELPPTVYYAIFGVEVDKATAFDIVASIGDPARYNQIQCPVKYLCGGVGDGMNEIVKAIPDLAIRGVVTRRHPARVSIGEDAGLQRGDLVTIYSQRADKYGRPYSKRISRARVGKVWANEAQVNFEANTAGNRKNGDVVVRTPDNHFRAGILATYTPHVWGGELLMDNKSGFTRSGIIHHFLMDLGFCMTDKPGEKFARVDNRYERDPYDYRAPMWANFGMGYGIGKTFLGFMDFMPYFLVQYEAAFMPSMSLEDKAGHKSNAPFCSNLRVPVGLRYSINFNYPTKLVIEAGYAYNLAFGDEANKEAIKQACSYLGAKRDGFFVNLGFIF